MNGNDSEDYINILKPNVANYDGLIGDSVLESSARCTCTCPSCVLTSKKLSHGEKAMLSTAPSMLLSELPARPVRGAGRLSANTRSTVRQRAARTTTCPEASPVRSSAPSLDIAMQDKVAGLPCESSSFKGNPRSGGCLWRTPTPGMWRDEVP